MTTIETARSRWMPLTRPALFRAVRLLLFGLMGWLGFVSATHSASRALSLGAASALAAVIGIMWYLSRAEADRRWRTAIDAYAKREQARTNSRRDFHAGPHSKDR